jgi:hypothetical protein
MDTKPRSILHLGIACLAFGLYILSPLTIVFNDIEDYVNWIESYHVFSVSILDFVGSYFVCCKYRTWIKDCRINKGKPTPSLLECFLSCMLLQFGGTTVCGMFLGVVPSWCLSHYALNALMCAWWLVFCFPHDLFFRYAASGYGKGNISIFIDYFLHFLRLISTAHAITSWGCDKGLSDKFHVNGIRISESLYTCIFAGMLSGGGGAILADYLNLMGDEPYIPRTLGMFANDNSKIKDNKIVDDKVVENPALFAPSRALLLSTIYIILTNESGHFDYFLGQNRWSRSSAKVLISSFCLMQHPIITDLFQSSFSYQRAISKFVKILNIPDSLNELQ